METFITHAPSKSLTSRNKRIKSEDTTRLDNPTPRGFKGQYGSKTFTRENDWLVADDLQECGKIVPFYVTERTCTWCITMTSRIWYHDPSAPGSPGR